MVYARRWVPNPWNRQEVQLRKIKDAKNKRERERKNRAAENDQTLLDNATAWEQEGQRVEQGPEEATGQVDGNCFHMNVLTHKYIYISIFTYICTDLFLFIHTSTCTYSSIMLI